MELKALQDKEIAKFSENIITMCAAKINAKRAAQEKGYEAYNDKNKYPNLRQSTWNGQLADRRREWVRVTPHWLESSDKKKECTDWWKIEKPK